MVATIFPLYDFARATAKEQANATMLMPPENSMHSFEPSPADIKNIQNADVFLYIGGKNDAWVKNILSKLDTSKTKIVRLIDIVKIYEEDEHIWTSPANAILMIGEIADVLCKKDSSNCNSYKENSQNYISQISELSEEILQTVISARRKQIIVADRFPFLYLTREYGLDYITAFPDRSDQSEASGTAVALIINTVKKDKIPYIYHIELSDKITADMVVGETGAKMLLLHSYHNLSKQDFEDERTYLDFMRQNAKNLKLGLLGE
jgi:zinc transport system substrate-binding protein